MSKNRMPRVEELIKRELTSIINKDMCLPDLGFITLTRVEVSKDLKHARVFVSVFGDKDKQEQTLNLLSEQRRNIFEILKPRLRMKYIPALKFILDHSAEYSDHISKRLMDIKRSDEEDQES